MSNNEKKKIEARRKRQSDANFALIGRYVQAFELMVDAARTGCILILRPRVIGEKPLVAGAESDQALHPNERLVRIALSHASQTAKPLFDIFRALIIEVMTPQQNLPKEELERKNNEFVIIKDILRQLAKEYGDATDFRNGMLHSTWHIGFAPQDAVDFSHIVVHKHKVTKDGLEIEVIANDKDQIKAETENCERIADMI